MMKSVAGKAAAAMVQNPHLSEICNKHTLREE